MTRKNSLILFLLSFLFIQTSFGHGDLHERILLVSQEIKTHPDSASLYFKRAKLYFHHNEFDLSILDLDQAAHLGFHDPLIDLFYAKANQKLQKHDSALFYTNKILRNDTSNVNAIKIQAQVLFAQKDFTKSGIAYENLINKSRRTLPENYLNASMAWRNSSDEEEKINAYSIIDRGMNELGNLPVFFQRKKEFYLEDNLFEDALLIQDQIIELSVRKEIAFMEAAEIAIKMKNFSLANIYLKKSELALNKLPKRLKETTAMKMLKKAIEKNKLQLSTKN